MYKTVHDLGPHYLWGNLVSHVRKRALRSSRNNLLTTFRYKRERRSGLSFSHLVVVIWNDLPEVLKLALSLIQFRKQ